MNIFRVVFHPNKYNPNDSKTFYIETDNETIARHLALKELLKLGLDPSRFKDEVAVQLNIIKGGIMHKQTHQEWLDGENEPELKRCPFCGGEVKARFYSCDRSSQDTHKIECYECDFFVMKNTKELTINSWNKRVA